MLTFTLINAYRVMNPTSPHYGAWGVVIRDQHTRHVRRVYRHGTTAVTWVASDPTHPSPQPICDPQVIHALTAAWNAALSGEEHHA
jgi:hypothetical protein